MAEQLATAAKLPGHEKAPTFDAIACTLSEKLLVSKKQFKAYFVALLADKEHAKVLEALAYVDKSFKSSAPGPVSGSSGTSAQASARPTARRPSIFCYACGSPGHMASRCFKRFNNLCFILHFVVWGGGQFRFLGHFHIFFVSFLICVLLGHFSDLSFSSFSPLFSFSNLPPSVAKSPTPFQHGSPRILLTRYPSNNTVFHGCVTMASPYSPGFSPLSLIILTWLRIG